jgi:hypothetical protein
MSEHDQRFKQLLQEFFPEFLNLFFPQQAARLDFSRVEWLDKELFPDAGQSDVYVLDLVARLRPTQWRSWSRWCTSRSSPATR